MSRNVTVSPEIVLSERSRLGLSQRQFAELMGVGQGAVNNWETGRNGMGSTCKTKFASVKKLRKRDLTF